MSEPVVIRVALGIYVICAVFAATLISKNAAAPDALKNSIIALASILPLAIAVLHYLDREHFASDFTFFLIHDGARKTLTMGDNQNLYDSAYMPMLTNMSNVAGSLNFDTWNELMGDRGIDIIEKGIIQTFLTSFVYQWDVVWSERPMPGGGREATGISATNGPVMEIPLNELREIFDHNPLISTIGVLAGNNWTLPPNSVISIDRSDRSRTIRIENKFTQTTLAIVTKMGTVAPQGIWGIIKKNPHQSELAYVTYSVTLTMIPKRWRRYAPEMAAYKRWFDSLSYLLRRFDWADLRGRIESDMARLAVEKQLGP